MAPEEPGPADVIANRFDTVEGRAVAKTTPLVVAVRVAAVVTRKKEQTLRRRLFVQQTATNTILYEYKRSLPVALGSFPYGYFQVLSALCSHHAWYTHHLQERTFAGFESLYAWMASTALKVRSVHTLFNGAIFMHAYML